MDKSDMHWCYCEIRHGRPSAPGDACAPACAKLSNRAASTFLSVTGLPGPSCVSRVSKRATKGTSLAGACRRLRPGNSFCSTLAASTVDACCRGIRSAARTPSSMTEGLVRDILRIGVGQASVAMQDRGAGPPKVTMQCYATFTKNCEVMQVDCVGSAVSKE
jgi:hypothetical protein